MKKYIHSLSVAAILLLSNACQEVIEQVPPSALTQTTFFKTSADAEAAILACYDALQGDETRLFLYGDLRADGLEVNGANDPSFVEFRNNLNSSSVYVGWGSTYRGINRVNGVLKQVPGITDPTINATRNRILGEAYFLRAFSYFYLVRVYGAVPLITEPALSLDVDFKVSRTPADEVLNQVVADLREAEQLLANTLTYGSNPETRGRATLGGVQALLTRVYLWRSSYRNTNEWQLAADYAAKVLANKTYSLVSGPAYGTIFTAKNTPESIFELQYSFSNNETNGMSGIFTPRSTRVTTGGNHTLIPTQKLINAFEPGDVRKEVSITYADNLAQTPGVRAVAKYPGTIVGTTRFSDSNYIFLRLADVILMRAEALTQLGNTGEAIALVNQIRKRAGLADTQASSPPEILLAIEQERFVELAFEGQRWYDLLRTGRYKEIPETRNMKELLPVSINDILINPNLAPQNEGY